MKIGQKLLGGLIGIVLLLSMAGGFGLLASGQIIKSYQSIASQFGTVVTTVTDMIGLLKQTESHFMRFMVLSTPQDKEQFLRTHGRLESKLKALDPELTTLEARALMRKLKRSTSQLLPEGKAAISAHELREKEGRTESREAARVNRIGQFHKTSKAIQDLSERLIAMYTEFLSQQAVIVTANSVQLLVKEMETYLNSFFITHQIENKEAYNKALGIVSKELESLDGKVQTSRERNMLKQMRTSVESLTTVGRFMMEACTQDLAISGDFDPGRYKKTLSEYYRTTNALRKTAKSLATINTELLVKEQQKGIQDAKTIQYSILIVMITATIGALVLSYILTQSISTPIRRLEHAAYAYGKGNLNTTISIKSKDEIGRLAAAFNQMAANLRQTMVSKSFVIDIIESTPETLLVLHTNLTIKMANRAALNLLGYSEEELTGAPISTIFAKESPLRYVTPEDFLQRTTESGVEETYLTKGNRKISVLFSVSPIHADNSSQVQEYVCSGKDITAHKEAENRLKRSLKELSDVKFALDQSAILVITDSQGIIQHVNDQYCSLTGYPRKELLNRQNGIAKIDDNDESLIEAIWHRLEEGKVWKGDIRGRQKSGTEYWLNATIVPFLNEIGEPFQYLGIYFDITERVNAEQEIIEAKKTAEDHSHAKSSFLAKMSHELRTPLNAILGYSELLQEELEDEGLDAYQSDLSKIHSSASHLLALINDILDLSKIEAGKMELYLETFKIRTVLDEVKSQIEPLMPQNENTLHLDYPEDLGDMHADFMKVKQILINLLTNAAKFCKKGDIYIRASRQGDAIEIRVEDSGIGISQDQKDRIFEAFTQADSSTTRRFGGTGLGLAITGKFCQMMGGSISVDSELDQGSTFIVRIPSKVAEPENS